VQSTQTLREAFQLRQPGPFRSCAQLAGRLISVLCLQGLTEQAGLGQHAFALQLVGLLIVLVPDVQLAGRQRVAPQGGEQRLGMVVVGARQRHQHPGGRPGRELTLADGDKQRLRQILHQAQPAVDPAHIPTALAGHLPLGKRESRDQLADDGAFLDGLPGAILGPHQDP
jgi:hypothetical protein